MIESKILEILIQRIEFFLLIFFKCLCVCDIEIILLIPLIYIYFFLLIKL